MSRRVLVTGAAGFVGRCLGAYLTEQSPAPRLVGADIAPIDSDSYDVTVECDLSSDAFEPLVRQTRPDVIVHLAGRFGADDPSATMQANLLATLVVLEAARKLAPSAALIVAGSAAEFGRVVPQRLPITEKTPCAPISTYGLSKQFATRAAQYYHRVHGLCTMVVRPFQLIGKGVSAHLAPGAFRQQLERAARDGADTIPVGNLDACRDFVDVRDAVRGIWMLSQRSQSGGIFNLCSGRPTRIGDLLDLMIEASGATVTARVDEARLRGPAEIDSVYGSYEKIHRHCGWEPRYALEQSVRDMFDQ